MKKRIIPWIMIVCMVLSACGNEVPEPERCSLCDDLSRHAPCIINLSTGEKLELDVYSQYDRQLRHRAPSALDSLPASKRFR